MVKKADQGKKSVLGGNKFNEKIFNILLLFMILINGRYSYSQVQVLLQQPPPNQLHIEDLWKLTLNNTSGGSYSVYLVGKVTEASRGEVLTAVTKNLFLIRD